MSSTMKGFLFAGIIVVLTVAAVESQNPLSCVQCNSLKEVCDAKDATECPSSANISCTSFSTNFYHETTTLVLKGCSNVNNSTCEFLGAENRMFRGVTFRKFECADSSTTTTPTPATTAGTGSQAPFTPLALASILLLRLLL
ncbi:hypothetical protein MG293_008470 [Ovis ammon polii]|uniref:Uncharacterized protein n=1 Tax=Ovis ammon polii TaxID=230172 RepID=A0AAD4U8E2_OVIAM|nr:hypothetical protein MG293_008470 [Ovis ammon polii]